MSTISDAFGRGRVATIRFWIADFGLLISGAEAIDGRAAGFPHERR
jgi:hypothetical protein